jgi:hypothetical protein
MGMAFRVNATTRARSNPPGGERGVACRARKPRRVSGRIVHVPPGNFGNFGKNRKSAERAAQLADTDAGTRRLLLLSTAPFRRQRSHQSRSAPTPFHPPRDRPQRRCEHRLRRANGAKVGSPGHRPGKPARRDRAEGPQVNRRRALPGFQPCRCPAGNPGRWPRLST